MEYSLDKIKDMKFETEQMPDLFSISSKKSSYRLTDRDLANLPDETKNITKLRVRLTSLYMEKLKGNGAQLEATCDIKRDTFRKVTSHKNGRSVTYPFLAKFCIGLALSIEEAKELFLLMGHELSHNNRYDYILLCELKNKGTLEEYNNDLLSFGYEGIISKAD